MRLIPRHRHQHPRTKVPRISISQEEIAADLHYPAGHRSSGTAAKPAFHKGRR